MFGKLQNKSKHVRQNENELTLIDCGLSSLGALNINHNITVINLHFNNIKSISHLDQATSLKHLDLSSNLIEKIQGLDKLTSLRTLNLSSNQISIVEGLQNLKNLVKLNLSYNQVRDLSGFCLMNNSNFLLSDLELQGNQIRSVATVVRCLKSLQNLKSLTLSSGRQKNPLCTIKNYRTNLLQGLSQLVILDGVDRQGNEVVVDVLADIPGLDDFLDVLSSNSGSTNFKIPTPKVDSVFKAFREISHPQEPVRDNEDNYAHNKVSNSDATTAPISSSTQNSDHEHHNTATKTVTPPIISTDVGESNKPKTKTICHHHSDTENSQSEQRNKTKISKKNKETHTNATLQARGSEITFGQVLRELDSERERRWKAEEACRRLSELVKSMREEAQNEASVQSAALSATATLREALMKEKDKVSEQNQMLEEAKEALQKVIEEKEHWEDEAIKLSETLKNVENSKFEWEKKANRKQHELREELDNTRCSQQHLKKELEHQVDLVEQLRTEVKQLQHLLVNKEKEYQQDSQRRYTLDSPQLQEYVSRQLNLQEKQAKQTYELLDKSLLEWQKKYKALEDEFRMALRIEANRFENVSKNHQTLLKEMERQKFQFESLKKKESESKKLVTELAQLVKEQKAKLKEVSTVKGELDRMYKERVETLELHLEEARKRMLQLEMLKQENKKLLGQIEAQESIIEGLRSERRLWSEELAQQGSSLAQDRGRLEAKIEQLQSELITAKINLERETDMVKIKAKLIEDQTEVIRKVKEGLQEKDNLIKSMQNQILNLQEKISRGANDEKKEFEELKLRYNDAVRKKESLKEELQDLQEKNDSLEQANNALNRKWKEKGSLISRLEHQVKQMQQQWEEKEATLMKERDEALGDVKSLQNRLSQIDAAFREQLKSAESARQEAIEQVRKECAVEIEKSYKRIRQVEQEMRTILMESDRSKKLMEEKVHRLTHAFQDLSGTFRNG